MKQKLLQLKWELETFNEHGKRTKETVRDYGWYVDDPEAKQIGVCIELPSTKEGINQSLYISAIELQTFVKAMPKTLRVKNGWGKVRLTHKNEPGKRSTETPWKSPF